MNVEQGNKCISIIGFICLKGVSCLIFNVYFAFVWILHHFIQRIWLAIGNGKGQLRIFYYLDITVTLLRNYVVKGRIATIDILSSHWKS